MVSALVLSPFSVVVLLLLLAIVPLSLAFLFMLPWSGFSSRTETSRVGVQGVGSRDRPAARNLGLRV